jgi:hypothetical protein
MAMNFFGISGEIKQVQVFDKNPAKASAVILVQYGPSRERGDKAIEFVNAVKVRIPPYRYIKIKSKLVIGAYVDVTGHLQGVYKHVMGEGSLTDEKVADRVEFEDFAEDPVSDPDLGATGA